MRKRKGQIQRFVYVTNPVTGEEESFPYPEWEDERAKLKYKYLLRESKIPIDYHEYELETMTIAELVRLKLRRWIEKTKHVKKGSLYLWSADNTTGKTAAACALGKMFMRTGVPVAYISAFKLINVLLRTTGYFEKQDDEARNEKKRLDSADVVIVDDIFDKNKMPVFTRSNHLIVGAVDSFTRDKCSEGKRLIYTSNKHIDIMATEFSQDLKKLMMRNFERIEFIDGGVEAARLKELGIDREGKSTDS